KLIAFIGGIFPGRAAGGIEIACGRPLPHSRHGIAALAELVARLVRVERRAQGGLPALLCEPSAERAQSTKCSTKLEASECLCTNLPAAGTEVDLPTTTEAESAPRSDDAAINRWP